MLSEILPSIIASKVASAAGGLLGGLTMFAFMRPKTILDATIRGGVSTGSAIISAPALANWMKIGSSPEMMLFYGAVTGFVAWGVLSMIARFFIRVEEKNMDIVDTYKEVKK